jgi:four helix bundle protein
MKVRGRGEKMMDKELSFDEWRNTVSERLRSEKFWQMTVYQKALYQYELLWNDTQVWMKDLRGQPLVKQVIASADSVCSNLEEGFGRGYGKQLLLFYGYSLGSARETKGRIYRARAFYQASMLEQRLHLASEVVALLLTEINRQQRYPR